MSTIGSAFTRRRFLVVGAGATAATLAGCGGGQSAEDAAQGGSAPESTFSGEYTGPNVELAYWNGFTGGDGPFMQDLVDQFNSEHDNIAVKSNTIQWADFYQRVPAAVNAGQGPDVGVMHLDQLATNAARRVIVPLDDVATALGISEEDFTPEVWQAGIYQDQRYGIPLDVHSLAMYYNTEMFEAAGITEPPTDRESFDAALQALRDSGVDQPFWMPSLWPSHLMFLSLLWQNGGQPYAEDGSAATFDSPEGVEALSWQVEQIEKGYSPRNVAIDSQYVAFKNGQVAITWDGIWQINDLEASGLPYGIAPIPQIGSEPAVWANSHHFFMTRQASEDENKSQAARVFIDWMSQQSGEWAGSGMIPARQSVRDELPDDLPQAPIAETIETMRFLPPVPGIGQVQTETLEQAVNRATLFQAAPEEALSRAADQATQLMEENLQQFGG